MIVRSAVVIPSRWGSTRFPGKPLVLIAGKPLIQRVYERASASSADEVWIATDDSRISNVAVQFGGSALMTSSDLATGTDRICSALSQIPDSENIDVVINVQGDEPLIEPRLIDRLIDTLRSTDADVVTLSCPLGDPSELQRQDVVKVVTSNDGDALYFSRSPIPHGNPDLARRHIGVYGFKTEALRAFPTLPPSSLELAECLEQLRLLQNGFKIKVLETGEPHLGVDRPEDVGRIEAVIARTAG